MEKIEVETTLTLADWQAYQACWSQRALGSSRSRGIVSAIVAAAIVVGFSILGDHLHQPISILSLLAGVLVGGGATILASVYARRRSRPEGSVLGPCTVTIDASGVAIRKPGAYGHHDWSNVQGCSVTTEHLFIWVDRIAGVIVPLRDLPAGVSREDLVRIIDSHRPSGAATELAPAHVDSHEPRSDSFKRFLKAFGTLLIARAPAAADLDGASRYAGLFAVFGALLWLVFDRWWAGEGAEFYSYGLMPWSWYCIAALATVWLGSRLAQPRVPFDRVLLPLLACVPVLIALHVARLLWLDERWDLVASLGIGLYGVILLARVLRANTLRLQHRAVLAMTLTVAGAVWLSSSADFSGRFWYAPPADDATEEQVDYSEQTRQSEALLFSQPARIDAAVNALRRPANLPAAAFFVGFAGVGEEHVFAAEIALAQQVIASRFGSQARSVQLVNDRRDLQALPLASPAALRYALQRVAARMNLEQDVLFLSLSSHGSKDGTLSVSNGVLALNDLSATEVAAALRDAGIRWKVVIVSACYAGTFISPLRDEHTIVIAAAARDRTSFGCADDRDLTYFGEAFYRDSLPRAASLEEAFTRARQVIAVREQEEQKTPSLPQAHFGRDIQAHLKEVFGHG